MSGGPLTLGTSCPSGCDPDAVCPAPSAETPEVNVTLTPFALDTFPVTVGRFRKFVDMYTGAPLADGAGADANAAPPGNTLSGWRAAYNPYLLPSADALRASLKCQQQTQPGAAMWTDAPGPNENKPINCVDWFHAFAFCIWDGGWLPLESEWEYAAAGGAEDRLYPWGEPPPDASRVYTTCLGMNGPCDATALPNVGGLPAGAGKWGQLDMGGYLFQWVQDANHFYTTMPGPFPSCLSPECFYPVEIPSQDMVVVRGGPRSSARFFTAPESRYPSWGIRCARPLFRLTSMGERNELTAAFPARLLSALLGGRTI